jgi:hypothetical protein
MALGEEHRIEGQHLRANRNHQRNALNSVPHVSCPAIIVLLSPFGKAAYAPDMKM